MVLPYIAVWLMESTQIYGCEAGFATTCLARALPLVALLSGGGLVPLAFQLPNVSSDRVEWCGRWVPASASYVAKLLPEGEGRPPMGAY